jgi:hypothetical protein
MGRPGTAADPRRAGGPGCRDGETDEEYLQKTNFLILSPSLPARIEWSKSPTRHRRRRDISLAQADNPLDFIGKFLDSTKFLSFVALVIACAIGWAIWRG